MYSIELLEETKKDLNIITENIFLYSFSVEIVDKIYKEIISNIFSLQIFPYRFIKYKNDYRVMTVRWKYKVFYKVDELNNKVIIYRVLSGLQDYESII